MANYMKDIAGLLGVELEESFRITDKENGNYQNYYRLSKKNGVEASCDNIKWEKFNGELLRLLMIGDVRIIKLS